MPQKTRIFNGKKYSYVRTITGLGQANIYLGIQRKIGYLSRKVNAGSGKYYIYERKK